jgi:hypothetical protein
MVNFRRPSYTRYKTYSLNTDDELYKLASTTQIEEVTPWEDFSSPTLPIVDDHISSRGRTISVSYFPQFRPYSRPSLSSRGNTSQSKSVFPTIKVSSPVLAKERKSNTYDRMMLYITFFHLMRHKEEEDSLESIAEVDRTEQGYAQFPSEISMDTSEMEYLRRTQMESIESRKRAAIA